MRRRNRFGVAVIVLLGGVAAAAVTASGQTKTAPARAVSKNLPRPPDGHPDLQGTYDLATLTPLERTAGSPLVLTDDQAIRLESQVAKQKGQLAAAIPRDPSAPPSGGGGPPPPARTVC